MATNNVLNVPLSGNTGTGLFVGSVSPTINQLTFNPPTQGIVGVTNGSNASAGYVGEVISSTVLFASSVTVVSLTNTDLTSITLSAGDWDIYANMNFTSTVTNIIVNTKCWINDVSATLPDNAFIVSSGNFGAGNQSLGASILHLPVSISFPTTYYASCVATLSVGNSSVCGFIYARRAR
jgi:hypothetical protein